MNNIEPLELVKNINIVLLFIECYFDKGYFTPKKTTTNLLDKSNFANTFIKAKQEYNQQFAGQVFRQTESLTMIKYVALVLMSTAYCKGGHDFKKKLQGVDTFYNIFYEAEVAYLLTTAGFEVNFNKECLDKNCDLIACKNGFKLNIECKQLENLAIKTPKYINEIIKIFKPTNLFYNVEILSNEHKLLKQKIEQINKLCKIEIAKKIDFEINFEDINIKANVSSDLTQLGTSVFIADKKLNSPILSLKRNLKNAKSQLVGKKNQIIFIDLNYHKVDTKSQNLQIENVINVFLRKNKRIIGVYITNRCFIKSIQNKQFQYVVYRDSYVQTPFKSFI